jgi:hypothetical protein
MPDGVDHDVPINDHVAISDCPVVEFRGLYRPRPGTPEAREMRRLLSQPGRPPSDYKHEWLTRWSKYYSEACAEHENYHIDGEQGPSKIEIAYEVAVDDYDAYPGDLKRWPYDPREDPVRAKHRVWDAVNRLSKR